MLSRLDIAPALFMTWIGSLAILIAAYQDIPINFVYLSILATAGFGVLLVIVVLLSPFIANRDSRESNRMLIEEKRKDIERCRQECEELSVLTGKLKEEAVDMKIAFAKMKNDLQDAYDIISRHNYTGNAD